MKKQVKGFGQFVNEAGLINESGPVRNHIWSDLIEDIHELAIFYVEGMRIAGKLTFASSGDSMDVDFPIEDTEDWESIDWHRHICGVAKENGADCVYFPEDEVIVKC